MQVNVAIDHVWQRLSPAIAGKGTQLCSGGLRSGNEPQSLCQDGS